MERKVIKLNKIPNDEKVTELVEFMVYFKLSYPTGQKGECTILLDDSNGRIITPDTIYKLSDELYIYLYLLSNKAIANMYKTIKDDKSE